MVLELLVSLKIHRDVVLDQKKKKNRKNEDGSIRESVIHLRFCSTDVWLIN